MPALFFQSKAIPLAILCNNRIQKHGFNEVLKIIVLNVVASCAVNTKTKKKLLEVLTKQRTESLHQTDGVKKNE